MNIIHITTELAPYAKVGGLADVVYGLCKALIAKNADVKIILPNYEFLDLSIVKNCQLKNFEITHQDHSLSCQAFIGTFEGLEIHLLSEHSSKYFSSKKIYGYKDDVARFSFFSKMALEYLKQSDIKVDLLHLHDWPTAIIASLYRSRYQTKEFSPKIILTLHCIEHQGLYALDHLKKIDLAPSDFSQQAFENNHINLLKSGLYFADHITTVSPSYKKEILTPLGGKGLSETMLKMENKLSGILNGIDSDYWNPKQDPYLPHTYPSLQKEDILLAKSQNKLNLQRQLKMPLTENFLLGCVTRLVWQKGLPLIEYAMESILKKGGQFILLGTSPDPEIRTHFKHLKEKHSNNKNVHFYLDTNEKLARMIFAAADGFIIPSLFEPCGLTQMIAMRFGTIPIVRKTGGLQDTVFDLDTSEKVESERNGFTFDFADKEGVEWALKRAFDLRSQDKTKWADLVQRVACLDFSWSCSADKYLELYKNTLSL